MRALNLIIIMLACGLSTYAAAFNQLEKCPVTGEQIGTQGGAPADVILLIPGAGARGSILTLGHFGNLGGYFQQVEQVLYRDGIEFALVPADPNGNDSVEQRASTVIQWVKRYAADHKRVLLLGHSLGGLVARVAVRDPSIAGMVSAVVSMSSPNRGDVLIDWLEQDNTRNDILHRLGRIGGFDVQKKRYMFQMALSYAHQYNGPLDHASSLPPIYSIVTGQPALELTKSLPIFGYTHQIIESQMQELGQDGGVWGSLSDGFVPAYAQVWGECLGYFSANHATSLGKTMSKNTMGKVKRSWHEIFAKLISKNLLQKKVPHESFFSAIETREVAPGNYMGKGHAVIDVNLEKVASIIKDYAHSCQTSHCRYHVPSVEETRVLGDVTAAQFYTWTKVKNVKSGTYFSSVETTKDENGLSIKTSMLSDVQASKLSSQYGLPHRPIMQSTDVLWTLKSVAGNADQTQVGVKIDVTSDSFVINRFPKKVLAQLEQTLQALLTNLAIRDSF